MRQILDYYADVLCPSSASDTVWPEVTVEDGKVLNRISKDVDISGPLERRARKRHLVCGVDTTRLFRVGNTLDKPSILA